jgi:hypothetical protein
MFGQCSSLNHTQTTPNKINRTYASLHQANTCRLSAAVDMAVLETVDVSRYIVLTNLASNTVFNLAAECCMLLLQQLRAMFFLKLYYAAEAPLSVWLLSGIMAAHHSSLSKNGFGKATQGLRKKRGGGNTSGCLNMVCLCWKGSLPVSIL